MIFKGCEPYTKVKRCECSISGFSLKRSKFYLYRKKIFSFYLLITILYLTRVYCLTIIMISIKKLVVITIPIIDHFEKIYVVKEFKVQFIYTYNFLPLKKLLFYISPSSYDKIIYLIIDNEIFRMIVEHYF